MLDLDLQGFWISDRTSDFNFFRFVNQAVEILKLTFMIPRVSYGTASISWDVVQEQIPAVDFVHKYENVFAFK
jgi:hypothetical protein